MTISMLLAHLVGDYIFQTDRIASWKGREMSGVLVHALIVSIVTFIFLIPFQPYWWEGGLIISLAHLSIDAVQLPLTRRPQVKGSFALWRFFLDQTAHITIIMVTLMWGGYLSPTAVVDNLLIESHDYPLLLIGLGYALLAMPAWVVLEFTLYGLVKGSPPDFSRATNKYVSSFERWLILTFVIFGQFLLVPFVAAPRLIVERHNLTHPQHPSDANLYLAKLFASITLAVVTGLLLRQLLLM